MNSVDILAYMRKNSKEVFTLSELADALGMRKSSLAVALNRLVKKGVITKGFKGQYINPFTGYNTLKNAVDYKKPAYVSMEYALSGDVYKQNVYLFTIVTTRKVTTSRIAKRKGYPSGWVKFRGDYVEYHHISPRLFFGYFVSSRGIPFAEPEKAVLDVIYFRYLKTKQLPLNGLLSILDDMFLEELNKKKIYEYAERFGPTMLKFIRKLDEDGWWEHSPEH